MIDIVFVSPPLSLEERYGHLAPGGSLMPLIGLCNLAAVTRTKGYTTRILDSVALCLGFEETIASLTELSPKYVGLTAATVSIHNAAEVARLLKQRNSNITTIIGGPHVTAVPVESMQRFAHFDVAVVGEGEATIVELLEGLQNGRDLKEIPGLVVRDEGEVIMTEPRSFIKDLDSLPMPAWDLLPPMPK